MSRIEALVRESVPLSGYAVDAFSGSGVVSRLFKQLGYTVIANDWQVFSKVLVSAALLSDFPAFGTDEKPVGYEDILAYLDALPPKEGAFATAYGEGGSAGRLYFSRDNAMRIQAIRDQIQDWYTQGKISDAAYHWVLAVVIEAADFVANTASVYGAYLKALKPTAQVPLLLKPIYPTPGASTGHQVYSKNAATLLSELTVRPTLIYVDPPYNERQYSANYHIPETIARWDLDTIVPRGKTGLRPADQQRSLYCLGTKAKQAFQELFLSSTPDYWLLSYSSEGLLSKYELMAAIPDTYRLVRDEEIEYQRFRADRVSENRQYLSGKTVEYLLLFKYLGDV